MYCETPVNNDSYYYTSWMYPLCEYGVVVTGVLVYVMCSQQCHIEFHHGNIAVASHGVLGWWISLESHEQRTLSK